MGDKYGLFGGDAATEDKYGLWGGAPPRKKRTRSKRPQARDVEAPEAQDDAEEDDAGADLMPEPDAKPDLAQGKAAGPAGTPSHAPNQREHAWYEPLLESTQSALQGAVGNLGDEATAAALWAGDKMGLTHSGNSFEENADLYKKDADRITRAYPYGHGAGQMATGMAASAVAAPGKLAQGAVQGALSAGSEYADSRDPWRTAGAGALGFGSGVLGSWVGGKLANAGATSREAAKLRELEELARRARPNPGRPPASGPDYSIVPEEMALARASSPIAATPQGPPRPLPIEHGAPYDPLARSSVPTPEPGPISSNGRPPPYDPYAGAAPEVPQTPRPQPNPAEMAYPYDPRAAGARPTPQSGPPRPLPSPPGAPYDPLAAQASPRVPTPAATAAEAAIDDLKDPVVRTALEMFTPTLQKRATAPELADWAKQVVAHKLPPAAESALMRAWTKRVKDVLPKVDPERLLAQGASGEADIVEEVERYALGELDAPKNALPSPRMSGGAGGKSPLEYMLGDLDAPTDAISRPRIGGGVEPSPSYRLGDLDAPTNGPPMPRVRGGNAPALPEYALGDVPGAPQNALPRPRAGGTPRDGYALGELVSEPPAGALPAEAPSYRLGDISTNPPPRAPSMPAGSERELQDIALKRAAQNAPPDLLGGAIGMAKGVVGGRSPTAALALRGAGALNSLRTPGMRELAIQSGDLVPNQRWGTAGRMMGEAAWELGAPGITGSKVNAQDGEHVAYADQATMNYALSETLHRGDTGLSQADEAALTSAVVNGDDDAIRATDFRLRQRYPAYARRVERALRNLNEED